MDRVRDWFQAGLDFSDQDGEMRRLRIQSACRTDHFKRRRRISGSWQHQFRRRFRAKRPMLPPDHRYERACAIITAAIKHWALASSSKIGETRFAKDQA